jgi:serine/threonine protein kinase
MKYLESKKVVHRDLAARNLLAAHGDKDHAITVRISDFGMSRKLEKTYYTIQGTKELPIKWSAPEVFNFGTWSNKSDVWAFGITMWEIFSYGAIPYPSMSNQQTVEEVEKGYRMPAPNECPPEVHKVMLKCWEKDPTERPTFEVHKTVKNVTD